MRAELSAYLAKWHLELEQPFETNSSQLPYVKRGQTRAVLKIPNPDSDEHEGAAILMHWGGPAARVLEHDEHGLLIERAMPGTTLTALLEAGRDEDATHIWCDVAQQLHTEAAPEGWPDIMQRGRSFLNPPRHALLPPDLVAQAREEYFALCEAQSPQRYLLHADLNHFNVLKDNARGWVVIDPKGFVGELAWETGTFLRNPIPHWDRVADPKVMERRVRILCDRLGFDPTRVLRWCAAQAVLSCIWSAEGHGRQAKLRGAMRMYHAARLVLSASQDH
jgi:streptomycin 6-kinase